MKIIALPPGPRVVLPVGTASALIRIRSASRVPLKGRPSRLPWARGAIRRISTSSCDWLTAWIS